MALLKLSDIDENDRGSSADHDIDGFDVYSQTTDEKVGSVKDILVDEAGHFRYLIVDLGFWIFGKKVLLPVGRSQIDYNSRRVYALGMTKEQAENLPEFNDNLKLDYDYEEKVRGVYRPTATGTTTAASTTAASTTAASTTGVSANQPVAGTDDRNTYNYQQDQSLYGLNEQDHQNLKLYEERLVANKTRRKTGEVTVGKHVETQTARVAVPIEKEQVIIERVTPGDAGRVAAPGEVSFQEGEVARIEVYEETPDIHKEAFVREEVRVSKQVEHDTVEAQETVRREELDIDAGGNRVTRNPQI